MKQIILDTETTGLEPSDGHRVIEIGCVEIANRRATSNHFQRYLNPERPSDPAALAIHGLAEEFLAEQPLFAAVVDDFLAFIRGAELIIHNARFDVGFLDAELARLGRGKVMDYAVKVTDTMLLAREQFPGKRNSLDALCQRFEINNSHRTLHGALLDSELLAEVYVALTRGQDSLVIDMGGASQGELGGAAAIDPGIVITADEAELVAHAGVMARISGEAKGKTVWKVA